MRAEVVVRVPCPRCGAILEARGTTACEARALCRKCGVVVMVDINVSIRFDKYDEKLLEEFKWWLVREKGVTLSTAINYVKRVREWLLEGKYPSKLLFSPIVYWREWRRMRGQG